MNRKLILTLVVLTTILVGSPYLADLHASPYPLMTQNGCCEDQSDDCSPPEYNSRQYSLSEDTRTGTLHPADIQQSGINVETTGSIPSRTDITPLIENDLALDTSNGWMSDQVEVNITNLEKLFVQNGTFVNGFPGNNTEPAGGVSYYPLGWDATSLNDEPAKQTIRACYFDASPSYVKLEFEGEQDKPDEFKFYKTSYVYWFQDTTHTPTETDFLLSFSYLYRNGPIGTRHRDDFEVRIEVDDGSTTQVIWEIDPTTLPTRDVWQTVGPIPLQLTGFAASFEFRLVLEVLEDRTFEGSRPDFDGDLNNAQFIRFCFDDVSLVGAAPPVFADTGLSVTLPFIGPTPISGAMGTGKVLVNHSYWSTSPIQFSLTSSFPISFAYEARIVNVVRFLNSTIATNSTAIGISYTIDEGESPSLLFYNYVPEHANYEGFTVHIFYSEDYENATVHNPFSVDVTSQVTLSPGQIMIDETVTDTIGWWIFSLEAPNYLEALSMQVFNESLSNWINSDTYLANDRARARISLGYGGESPDSPLDIEVKWHLPNGTEWFFEAVNGDSVGNANSSGLTFGPTNSTAGFWSIVVFWENGSVLAYDESLFQVHHATSLLPAQPIIDAQLDTNVTGAVTFTDIDNGEILLDVSAEVVGNWSSGSISFSPNLAKGWWEADFDTSLVGIGNYSVLVNASLPFYENASCIFEIHVTSSAVLKLLIPSYSAINLGESFTAKFRYEFLDNSGVEDATIEVYSWDGPVGGLDWYASVATPGEPGNYSIEFTAIISGHYQITARGIKAGVNNPITNFELDVGTIGTELVLLNGTGSAISIIDQFNLIVQYRNSTGHGLSGANVDVADIIPAVGLGASPTQYLGNGTYSILLTPTLTGSYTLVIGADLLNHQYRSGMFSLSVAPLSSYLILNSTTGSIAVDRNYTLMLQYLDGGFQGLENASVSVLSLDPATGLTISEAEALGNGSYSLVLSPQIKGDYTLVIVASLQNYQNGTAVFTLFARDVPTRLRSIDGQSSAQILFSESYELFLLYERTDMFANVTGAAIEINLDGLLVNVTETPLGYRLSILGSDLGDRLLRIKASKPNYRNATFEFYLEIIEIPTTVQGSGILSELYFDSLYDFSVFYNSSLFGGVTGADIILLQSGIPARQISWSEIGNGYYNFSIHPRSIGAFSLSFSFSKRGYSDSEISFTIDVNPVPISLSPNSEIGERLDGIESTLLPISFRLIASNTGEPLSNAVIAFIIENTPTQGFFEESEAGYSAFIPVPAEGVYTLLIEITKENCTSISMSLILVSAVNIPLRAGTTMAFGFPPILLLGVAVGVRRVNRRRTKERSVQLFAMKKRFEDVRNIIGFLVIYKGSGLPIFSKVMKGGFEEGMMSGFISAITTFASEIRENAKLRRVYPISEVVSAYETENLIFALITVDAPSDTLVSRLEELASSLSDLFDLDRHILAQISQDVKSAIEYSSMIDTLFFSIFDEILVSQHILNVEADIPRRLMPIRDVLASDDDEKSMTLEELVDHLIVEGLDEKAAYSIVLEAMDSRLLQVIYSVD